MFKKIFLLLIIALISLQVVYAGNATTSFPSNVTLVDKQISVDFYIYNPTSTVQTYTLKSYTAPYPSYFSETTIRLQPNTSKLVPLTITPLENQLESTYSSSIEVTSIDYYNKITFTILQKTNRVCQVDLQYFISYVKESDNYKLELIFKNNSNINQNIDVLDLRDINLEVPIGKISTIKATESSLVRLFKTDINQTKLDYRCNGIYSNITIDLPKKDVIKPNEPFSVFTGLFSLGNIDVLTTLDSTVFQIILIFILIILVLSFSTRYIRYVYRK
ncbi:MAG: hypothetical protein WCX82_01540 [archaeon]|jgi:hypothetical protein